MIDQPHPTGNWLRESVLLKLLLIMVIALLLLIPSSWIQELVRERSDRQEQIVNEDTDKWSGRQLIQGPVLVIPYKKAVREKDSTGKEVIKEYTQNLYLLSDDLNISANVKSDTLKRGIYDIGVYDALLSLNGRFNTANIARLQIDNSLIQYQKARLLFSLGDLKGLKADPTIRVQNRSYTASSVTDGLLTGGLQAEIDLSTLPPGDLPFSLNLQLKGSQSLRFIHAAKTTQVEVKGNWPSPKFDGRYLPNERSISKAGFYGKWRMLNYNRPFPQQWVGNDTLLNSFKRNNNVLFGVQLHIQVDDYQKTMRTSKYAILIIALTFVSLFLTEVIQKKPVHVFNYALIGAAMIVFYSLLLSFSEQVGYNWAYLIAAVATIALIAWFTASLLNSKAAALFAVILSVFYGFVFVIIQLEELSLLVGSIALFVVIAALMYFSRKINWN
ncbi:cell envelope integrity protein CreD [Mucilaginibacter daejeonensis]|uniref:cell envelope integrity protein CreD n=1 Tax=Mucilaginibacter daejeonensis TaxID=398049 RepID=UPI001D170972|nr:cell envelope integrity protein CreD [Mucilaginibacter daejeonensis]UEG53762.1 cell envelope integrity protein CreD [Mucilaginibacter daejeonensis]